MPATGNIQVLKLARTIADLAGSNGFWGGELICAMGIDMLETAAWSRRKQGTTQLPCIDPERDVDRVRQRYLKQSKIDLVERLLIVEYANAEKLQQLARLHFELVEHQQKCAERK